MLKYDNIDITEGIDVNTNTLVNTNKIKVK